MNNLYKALAFTAALPIVACGGNTTQPAEREPPKPREELSDLTVLPTGFAKTQTAKWAPGRHYTITWRSEDGQRDCGDAYLGEGEPAEAKLRLREAQFDEAIRTATRVTVSYVHIDRDDRHVRPGTPERIDPRMGGNDCLILRDVEFHWK